MKCGLPVYRLRRYLAVSTLNPPYFSFHERMQSKLENSSLVSDAPL